MAAKKSSCGPNMANASSRSNLKAVFGMPKKQK